MTPYPDTARQYDLSSVFFASLNATAQTTTTDGHGGNDEILTSLVLLNRSIAPLSVFERLWRRAKHRICADGAANWLYDELSSIGTSRPTQPNAEELVLADDFIPDAIVGDMDSVRPEVQSFYEKQKSVKIVCDESQYSTDFSKSLKYAYHLSEEELRHRTSRQRQREQEQQLNGTSESEQKQQLNEQRANFVHNVIVRGSLAGRVDQGIGVLHELYRESRRFVLPSQSDEFVTRDGPSKASTEDSWELRRREADGPDPTDASLFMERRRLWLVSEQSLSLCLPPGTNVLNGMHVRQKHKHDQHMQQGHKAQSVGEERRDIFAKHCGILPVFGAASITTTGLEYDVQKWYTEMGGRVSSSNHVVSKTVTIETDNWVLFTIAFATEFLA